MRKRHRLKRTVSEQVENYLEALSLLGIHGAKPTEVANALILQGIERLIRQGFLELNNVRPKK